jgi:uncharacterized protein YjiS (DUF1127 family)
MHPYYFDFDQARTHRAMAILSFERAARRGWPPRPPGRSLGEVLNAAVALVRLWRQRAREREQLAHLDTRMLRDIGITPYETDTECNKPFWRA